MSDLVVARNCCMARMLGVGINVQVCQGGAKSVFERSNGLDTALYKNYHYFFFYLFDSKLFIISYWLNLLCISDSYLILQCLATMW